VRTSYNVLGAAAGIAILTACTGGQSGIEPPFTAVNPQTQSSLQFRVGTVNYQGTSTYTNTVVTFRQPNGLSATLYNTPTITAPAGFVVPVIAPNSATTASGAGVDAGTNQISATQPTQPGVTAVATTFAQVGGAFSYGFAPANSTTGGTAFYPGNGAGRAFGNALGATITDVYTQPIYRTSGGRRPFVLGPPAVPDFHNATLGFPAGFLGYDSGFTSFAVTPLAGTYALHLTVPSSTIGQNSAVFDVNATLTNMVPLANEAAPPIGVAGSNVTFTVAPAAAPTTFQVVYVVQLQQSGTAIMFAFNAGAAGGTFTLPLSQFTLSTGACPGPTCVPGDLVAAYTVGSDWDIVGGASPNNSSATPLLPAQTDISISPIGARQL
jgi:hypothetical protein